MLEEGERSKKQEKWNEMRKTTKNGEMWMEVWFEKFFVWNEYSAKKRKRWNQFNKIDIMNIEWKWWSHHWLQIMCTRKHRSDLIEYWEEKERERGRTNWWKERKREIDSWGRKTIVNKVRVGHEDVWDLWRIRKRQKTSNAFTSVSSSAECRTWNNKSCNWNSQRGNSGKSLISIWENDTNAHPIRK